MIITFGVIILLCVVVLGEITDWDELSRPGTSVSSYSDAESDYVTGVEDLLDNPRKSSSEDVFKYLSNPSHTSSFIQSILYEDSCAGVAVVDLFVAVKVVKDKLDILARCNNEILEKITMMNKEKAGIKLGYKNLIDSMRIFLKKLSENELQKLILNNNKAESRKQDVKKLPLEQSNESSNAENKMAVKKTGETCEKSSNDNSQCHEQKSVNENKKNDSSTEDEMMNHPNAQKDISEQKKECPNCHLSTFGENAQNYVPRANEELLGSFLASLLWLKKKEKDLCIPWLTSKVISQMQIDMKKNMGRLNLSESKVQMVCDVWKILCGPDQSESEPKRFDDYENPEESNDVNIEQESSNGYCEVEENQLILTKSKDSLMSIEDATSDGESIFEEALTDLAVPSTVQKAKHNVTCMGDLCLELTEKKNVGTFTTNSDVVLSSWVTKLTEEIQAKINEIKSKTNITVVQRPCQKSMRKQKKQSGGQGSEFVLTADTPMGVIDLTVLQYQKRRRSKDFSKKTGKLVGTPTHRSKEPPKHKQLPTKAISIKDDEYFSDIDLCNSESVPIEDGFNSGEDEFEEFMDMSVENSKKDKKTTPKLSQKGTSKKCIIKIVECPYFEIYKFHPVHPVLEIIRKTANEVFSERSNGKIFPEGNIISINTAEKQTKEMIIKRSSSDLVIYIQVEVEEGHPLNAGQMFVEYQTSSLGTQTRNASPYLLPEEEDVVRLEEKQQCGESLYHIWKDYAKNSVPVEDKNWLDFDTPFMIVGDQEMELRDDWVEEEKEVMVKEPKEKSVTFNEVTEIFIDKNLHKTYSEEENENNKNIQKSTKTVISIMNAKLHADIWFVQNEIKIIQRAFIISPVNKITNQEKQLVNYIQPIVFSRTELEKALTLIQEIENDVMDIKLSDAILILPRLESELRKHLQSKMKSIKELNSEKENSVDNFYSAIDFLPYEHLVQVDNDASEQRLSSLLRLLSDLEEAVKENSSHELELCEFNSSVIYGLLRELTDNIMDLEKTPTVSSFSRTLDVASQLDTAVREYDSARKKQSLNYGTPETESENTATSMSSSLEAFVNEQLKNVRKKVFKKVKKEALDMEGKIEKYFDKIDRLERENDETMMFLETFLQKTERRVTEFKSLKTDIEDMTLSINALHGVIMKTKKEIEKEIVESKDPIPPSTIPIASAATENKPKDSISGLLIALDSLKTKAKEKNEICKEILSSIGFDKSLDSGKSLQSSNSSIATPVETITSTVQDFKKIGDSSLYLSWAKPTCSPSISVLGYEIYVNGTVNQKVRNPQRLQAILYSVDLSKETEVHLYALTDAEPKTLLATLKYSDN